MAELASEVKETQDTEVEVQEQVTTESAESQEAQQEETPEEINWRKFREDRKREREEKEAERQKREEAEKQAAMLKEMVNAMSQPDGSALTEQQKEQIIAEMPLDDFTTGEHVKSYVDSKFEAEVDKRVDAALSRIEAKRKEEDTRRKQQELPQTIRREMPDFDTVCHSDNLDYLEYHYPEVASVLAKQADSYDKWASIYKTVKRLIPNVDSKKQEKRIDDNANKPRSLSSPGITQSGDSAPAYLSPERKRENWMRMQRQMKGG